jgi:hypothetical protein
MGPGMVPSARNIVLYMLMREAEHENETKKIAHNGDDRDSCRGRCSSRNSGCRAERRAKSVHNNDDFTNYGNNLDRDHDDFTNYGNNLDRDHDDFTNYGNNLDRDHDDHAMDTSTR